ncbi:acyl-CoA dehydrogenase family protein [Nocardia tenerifensis]|uniref:acyl-CoA dehydrogenase family protein n=1 Tax=Nocardia tenerifensis TaxID=228006 RepID=UPI0014614C0A|nr:acyl-CoA dehydrogenase family protein [Nocardia tenerifensis]
MLDPADRLDWERLAFLEAELDNVLDSFPLGPQLPAGAQRSDRLRSIRVELANRGHLDAGTDPALFALLTQFVCGYRDIDLRDATGLGHGALIARHGSKATQHRWMNRLMSGGLAGIAMTEPHGGSRPAAARTCAVVAPDGTWLVSGRKTWISRLTEAVVFVVSFRTPDGHLVAAAVDAVEPGLRRQLITPAGLAGWSWGTLDLECVPIRADDVLSGDAMVLLRRHFAGYRPLVAATALGGAAAVFDQVVANLTSRYTSGEVARLWDSALATVGRAHAQLTTALLGTVIAAHMAEAGNAHAERWGAVMKAHGIDTANQVAAELTLLLGASGFRSDSHVAKVRRDLNGLLYADGIHDSLYRAAGKRHTAHPNAAESTPYPFGALSV